MDRRNFMRSLFAMTGAGALATTFAGKAEAASLLDELKAMEGQELSNTPEADLPAEDASESQHWRRRRRRRYYRGRPRHWRRWRRRRVRRCFWRRNRWGRPVRVCRWIWR